MRYTSAHATFTVVSEPFETNSTQTALSASGTTLIDNRTAIVTITLHGIDNPSEHSYQLRAVPDQAEGIVNKYGTDVFFSPTSDPLVWRTSKIYWYGKNPGQCCASYRFPYHFSLSVDDGLCGSEASYPVQMPENEDPCMYGDVEPTSESIIHEPMLESINIRPYLAQYHDCIEEVTCGGESGEEARICDYAWILNTMMQCVEYNVSFHFKQTGARFKRGNRVYQIDRKDQLTQAMKAGIDFRAVQKQAYFGSLPI